MHRLEFSLIILDLFILQRILQLNLIDSKIGPVGQGGENIH